MQSRSRSSSSVRCGCQYFQSTELLPERMSLIGTPPSSRQSTMGEQEDEREDDERIKPPQQTKLVTPALAGLTTLLAASPILSVSPGKVEEEKQQESHDRKCIRIPNDDGVIIPLHGDSDEEINPERYADPSLVTVQKTNEPTVSKTRLPYSRSRGKEKAPKPPKTKVSSTQKLVTPTLAGLSTVIAASPIISEPSDDKVKEDTEVRKFIKSPTDDTLIVPLHGDSDEELHPEWYSDPSLLRKQRIDGPVIEEYVPSRTPGGTSLQENLDEEESKLIELPEDKQSKPASKPANVTVKKTSKSSKQKESPKLVTPTLAGMTTLLAASPILSMSPGGLEQEKTEEIHERKIIRIPNEEGVIIPLHGDSDEELNPERYKDPSLQGVQKIGDITVEEIRPIKKVDGASKSAKDQKESSSSAAKLVTPALAGLTTLLAASPILSVSPGTDHEEGDKQEKEDAHERKFIRMPNEEGVIIPLHGDSDEEINPERYEDPTLLGVQKIGETIEEIKPSKIVSAVDSKKSKHLDSSSPGTKLVTPALAGLTTLLAASPILSVSPGVEQENEDGGSKEEAAKEEVHERKFIRMPGEDSIMIPLHGDSDEEINPERYEDLSLLGVQKIGEVEVIKPSKKVKVTESKPSKIANSEDEPSKKTKRPSSLGKLVTPALAGLTTLLAASPILSVSPSVDKENEEIIDEDAKSNEIIDEEGGTGTAREEIHERKFIRMPNEEGVIIPLHGDSDEEINPERYEDPSLHGVQKIGEIEVIKPSKKAKAVESKKVDEPSKKKVTSTSSSAKLVTPTLAGMTTLLAASPILSVSPGVEQEKGDDEDAKEGVHERKFIRTPNEDDVIIPLHGDSDEEINPERYEDPSLLGVQKVGEVEVIKPSKKAKEAPSTPSKATKSDDETSKKTKRPSALGKMVTPALAGMTTLLAASPILSVSPGMKQEKGDAKEDAHERKFIRMPDQEGVIIPLHGDSDEEINPERYEDPSLIGVQKIGETVEEIKTSKKVKAVESKPSKQEVSGDQTNRSSDKSASTAGKLVTPMLAGMTTLLAASPILSVSSSIDEGESKIEEVEDRSNRGDVPIERKFIKTSNDEGIIVPLHGDSDEEIHPERYEDPSMIGVQRIEGPTLENIKPSPSKVSETKRKGFKAAKIKLATEKATKEAAKLVTPMLAGMTTLLASSPLLTVSPKRSEAQEEGNEELGVERTPVTVPNQPTVIIPLHGDSGKDLHPERRGSPELEAMPRPEEPVVDESVAPVRPSRTKAQTITEPEPTVNKAATTSEKEEVVTHQIINEVHLARDHEYEPVNPKEPPPSPPREVRQSRADQAEREKFLQQKPVEDPAASATAQIHKVPSASTIAQAPVEPPPTKLVTPSLAGITTLLVASPILSVEPEKEREEEIIEEVKKDEVFERKFIKIPDDKNAIIIPLHGDSDEELHPERYKDPSLHGVQRIEGPVVEEFKAPLAAPPLASKPIPSTPKPQPSAPKAQPSALKAQPPAPVTLPPAPKPILKESQSVYEPIQSPDDMALDEALPLSFQDRFKAGAGEFRDKIRNMTVPKISLPDRPRISLPDRPKMKLPERPQFLKETPQFLKERPQFLKERPQFLKERPKFLKEKPKFLTERPKFHLPDRSKFKVPEKFKFDKSKKVDKPKIRKPNPSSQRRPLRDVITISSESSHNLFETLKARTYPRFLSKKKRERDRVAQLRAQGTSLDTESSLPPSPPDNRKLFPERYRDIRFADEEPDQRMDVQSEEGYEENTAPFHESYVRAVPYITAQGPEGTMKAKIDSSSDIAESDKEQISSGASSMRHRQGVLEEIDSDEFFLRQKGLSREDVDVSRYLSKEIRDAFRSPKNALAHMDSTEGYDDEYDDEESPDLRYQQGPPEPPERTKNRSESRDSDFNTFPIKPTRRKHSGPSDFGSSDIFEKVKKPPRKYRSKSDTRQGSVRSLDVSSRRSMMDEPPQPPSRQKSLRSLTRSRPESAADVRGGSVRREVAHDVDMAPVRPLRKSRSRGASVDERTSRGADSLPHDYGDYEPEEEQEEEEEEEDIDVDEEELEEEIEEDEDIPEPAVHEHVQVFRTIPTMSEVPVRSGAMEDDDIPGYAVVRKPKPPRPPPPPPKSRKEQLQSQLHSIKAQGINFFQTFPRRAMKKINKPRLPVHPLRNYNTLGPVRPPRRSRVFREPVYVDGDLPEPPEEEPMKEHYDLKHEYEETRDLQSGEIVERMKGRPLPPPPRPPRRSRDDDSLPSAADSRMDEVEDDNGVEITDIPEELTRRDEFFASMRVNVSDAYRPVATREEEVQASAVHAHPTMESSQQTSFETTDVSVSIQTDPLPEGIVVDDPYERETDRSQRSQSTGTNRTVVSRRMPETRPVDETAHRREAPREYSQHDPRRLFDPDVIRQSEEATREESPPPLPQRNIPPPAIPPPITIPPVQVSFPDKLHLTQLDVDKLSVNELQANSIKVSDIDGMTMQISEITGTSGNLVLNGIELPPDFIKNLVAQIPVPKAPEPVVVVQEKVIIQERARETTPQPHLKRILTPPPPIVVQHTAQSADEVPSPPIHQASTTEQLAKPQTTRTRRKSPTRLVDDSEEELASVINERERKERERLEKEEEAKKESKTLKKDGKAEPSKDSPAKECSPAGTSSTPLEQPIEPSALELIKQLLTIWYRNLISGTGSLVNGINSIFPENEKRRDAQTAALILIVIIAALILLGLGADQSVHHHHWDYLNPPR